MSNKHNGGAAFPTAESNYHNENMRGDGMSLRDYFAAKASTSMEPPKDYVGASENADALRSWARRCYQMADALLAERAK